MAIPRGETPRRKDWFARLNLARRPSFVLTGKFTPPFLIKLRGVGMPTFRWKLHRSFSDDCELEIRLVSNLSAQSILSFLIL